MKQMTYAKLATRFKTSYKNPYLGVRKEHGRGKWRADAKGKFLGYFDTAEEANAAVQKAWGLKPNSFTVAPTFTAPDAPVESREYSKDEAVFTTKSPRIQTLEQLIEAMEVDLESWDVERYVINKWEVGATNGDGEILTEPLFQVKAWLKKKTGPSVAEIVVEGMLEQIEEHAPVYTPLENVELDSEKYLLEICIPDLHMGKLCWGLETGTDFDLKLARQVYVAAVNDLMSKALAYGGVEKVVLPIGNDFFHIDNSRNTTTAGTSVDVDSRWQKSYLHGKNLLVEVIDFIQGHAPVDVLVIPGNHDNERMFYLGDALQTFYRNCPNVTVDNSPKPRKYYKYEKNLIGFTHGDEEKRSELPLIMASEAAEMWGDVHFREFHVGHWHRKSATRFQEEITEHQDIRVRTIPSLSASDAWHVKKGYRGSRSAEAFLWHPTEGCIMQHFFNVRHGTNGN